jgi:hypothetical protein
MFENPAFAFAALALIATLAFTARATADATMNEAIR